MAGNWEATGHRRLNELNDPLKHKRMVNIILCNWFSHKIQQYFFQTLQLCLYLCIAEKILSFSHPFILVLLKELILLTNF